MSEGLRFSAREGGHLPTRADRELEQRHHRLCLRRLHQQSANIKQEQDPGLPHLGIAAHTRHDPALQVRSQQHNHPASHRPTLIRLRQQSRKREEDGQEGHALRRGSILEQREGWHVELQIRGWAEQGDGRGGEHPVDRGLDDGAGDTLVLYSPSTH